MSSQQLSGCTGKYQYLTWNAANRAMSRNRFHPDSREGRVTVYRCRFCAHWHIGKSRFSGAQR